MSSNIVQLILFLAPSRTGLGWAGQPIYHQNWYSELPRYDLIDQAVMKLDLKQF